LLNRALQCFKSHNFIDKKRGEERINTVQEIINKINSSNIVNKDTLNSTDELNQFIGDVIRWNNDKDYILTVKNCEEKEKKFSNLFENISFCIFEK
jgi:hypothetical protein